MYSYKLREEVDLETVAAALPDSCTGADLLQVVSTARSAAIRALVSKLHAGETFTSYLNVQKRGPYRKVHPPRMRCPELAIEMFLIELQDTTDCVHKKQAIQRKFPLHQQS